MRLFIDFETRSDVDIKRAGHIRYAESPQTQPMCMAFGADPAHISLWLPGEPYPLSGATELHAHNAAFERAIYNRVMVRRYGWPVVPDMIWHCTAAKAAHANIARQLDQAGDMLKSTQVKDKEGHQIMLKLSKPNRKGEFIYPWDDPEAYEKLYAYCIQDVRTEMAIDALLPSWPESERVQWVINEIINDRGVPIDAQLCRAVEAILGVTTVDSANELTDLTGGEVTKHTQVQRILKYVNERGVNIDNLQAPTLDEILDSDLPDEVKRVLEIRRLETSAAVAKYSAALRMLTEGGRARGAFLYFGAAPTGRMASVNLQLQNMKKAAEKFDESAYEAAKMEDAGLLNAVVEGSTVGALGGMVRGIIHAPEGKTLGIIDYSQIECRVVHWLAGDERMLQLFREGKSPYERMAAKIYGVPEDSITKSSKERQVAKVVVLGGGYGMGAKKFQGYVKAQAGIILSPAEAKNVVDVYRQENYLIPRLWKSIEKAAIEAVRTGQMLRSGKLVFGYRDPYLTIRLPSGRRMFYYKPYLAEGQYGPVLVYNRRQQSEYTWGGTLTENACQGIARDLLCDALTRLRDYYVIATIHDEIVFEFDEATAESDRVECEKIMTVTPSWAEGLPLAVEGHNSRRYTK